MASTVDDLRADLERSTSALERSGKQIESLRAEIVKLESERNDLARQFGEEVAARHAAEAARKHADGLFVQANADRDRLKRDLEMETMARQDADRRFSESAMAHSRANAEIEEWKDATGLLSGGDPSGVTPKMLRDWIGVLDTIAESATRVVDNVNSGNEDASTDLELYKALEAAVESYRKMPEQ